RANCHGTSRRTDGRTLRSVEKTPGRLSGTIIARDCTLLARSTAAGIESEAPVPRVIVLPIHVILHPMDFSDRSDYAFQLACRLARESQAALIVLHVVEPPPFVTHGEMEKALQQAQGYRRDLNKRLEAQQNGEPDLTMEIRLTDGEPVAEILSAAEESNCDLIVMGTHGRTGFRRLLLGSVAEQVLRRAPCPVLTVNTPLQDGTLASAMKRRESTRA